MYIGIAKQLSLLVESCKKFEVTLANGRIFHCQDICPKVKLTTQDQKLKTDLLLLPLKNCKVVVGIEWLQTLGDIY